MIFPACSFLDYSTWNNTANLQVLQPSSGVSGGEGNRLPQHAGGISSAIMAAGAALPEGEGGGGDSSGDSPAAAAGAVTKPMPMSERARLARVPQPEQGLNCPRCDSTNTKFCYFNNYSLTQPRHFCRACRRYWTRGGALRSVPVGGGYRRHAKRAKPAANKQQAPSASAAGATTTNTTTDVATGAMLSGGGTAHQLPPAAAWQHRFADFDMATNLGLSFFPGTGGGTTMEQQQYWRAPSSQVMMHSFPFFHAMDHQMATPSMFHHLGLEMMSGEDGKRGEPLHEQAAEYPAAAAIRASSMYGDVTGGHSMQ